MAAQLLEWTPALGRTGWTETDGLLTKGAGCGLKNSQGPESEWGGTRSPIIPSGASPTPRAQARGAPEDSAPHWAPAKAPSLKGNGEH